MLRSTRVYMRVCLCSDIFSACMLFANILHTLHTINTNTHAHTRKYTWSNTFIDGRYLHLGRLQISENSTYKLRQQQS